MLISTVLIYSDDCITWCGAVGCFIWWRKYSCLCFGFLCCLGSCCYCNPQAARSFQQIFQVIWFSFWLMTEAASSSWQPTWILLSAAPWTCSVTFRGIDSAILRTYHILIKRIYTFHIQFHSFFFPIVGICTLFRV